MKKAADGNRTRDLRTTNATHYRLCYSSINTENYNTIGFSICQHFFQINFELIFGDLFDLFFDPLQSVVRGFGTFAQGVCDLRIVHAA